MSKVEVKTGNNSESAMYLAGVIENMGERIAELEEMRREWLERNVAAEGEVTVLRERVDQQERKIQQMDSVLDRTMLLLKELIKPAPAGKLSLHS